jgi:hypothetical protein
VLAAVFPKEKTVFLAFFKARRGMADGNHVLATSAPLVFCGTGWVGGNSRGRRTAKRKRGVAALKQERLGGTTKNEGGLLQKGEPEKMMTAMPRGA